jgi:hypothetical protein
MLALPKLRRLSSDSANDAISSVIAGSGALQLELVELLPLHREDECDGLELKFVLGVRAMRNILGRAALASVVILASNGWFLAAADSSGSSILEPASGAMLGAYYGAGNLAQTTAKLGRTPAVHLTYYAWADDWTGAVTKADLAAGRIPLVNWEPHKVDFTKIVDGSRCHDSSACKRLKSTWEEVLPGRCSGDEW